MATITVRALDPITNDPLQGNGQNNFISDLQAVTQIIRTRLLLFQGEWFLNQLDGLPLFQSILGASASSQQLQTIINLISINILGFTPYVTSIASVTASYQNRSFKFAAKVNTIFGTVFVTNVPSQQSNLG